MFVCVTCSSWHSTREALKIHKSKKECLQVVKDRADEKKKLRALADAERKAKLSGSSDPVKNTEPKKVTEPKKEASVVTDEIETKVDSAEVETTTTSEEVNEDASVFDADGFKKYLVDECDVKIQKISRMKEEKLKGTYEEFLPSFLELGNNPE